MSNASPFESTVSGRRVSESLYLFLPAVRFAGFWTAVFLPFVLVSLLVSGIATNHPFVVSMLLVLNVLGLALGRDYNR